MKRLYMRTKMFLKACSRKVVDLCTENKKAILLFLGKLILFACKILIEMLIKNHS